MIEALGIEVPPDLLRRWVSWLAPDRQPFFLTEAEADSWSLATDDAQPDQQLRDTYQVYGLPKGLRTAWLDEATFSSLPRATRAGLVRAQFVHHRDAVPAVKAWAALVGPEVRQQADGHRFVWWPSLLQDRATLVLPALIGEYFQPSDHSSVAASTWERAAGLLPRARELSGTFPVGSGPNCFGTVMAAAGVEGAAEIWMQRQPFEDWLSTSTKSGGRDDVPGTVLVWRDRDRLVQHAAVSLGDGWLLHKPSQSWMSPRKVRPVKAAVQSLRTPGWRLERHFLLEHG
jgi:hypothetical protein